MSTPFLATIAQSHSPKQPEIIRKTACFHPSVWGDHFITYTPDDKVLNLAYMIDVVYKDEDGYAHVGTEMKKCIASLLIDPVLM
ncbi:putative sesquiterpene synthase [Camellia lanceoleosa]|uniref:Sesquiterpene synthase n=1 Tax=Camellia lanceoleosa TaxID=1840588 RepID=A0ACC0HDM5_9ERIC|nr:putative sesquiterpene synthase [Camellia lanceoleosa]